MNLKMKQIQNSDSICQKKTGIKSRAIDTEKFVDVKLAALIKKGMKSKTVSRKSIMEILEQK